MIVRNTWLRETLSFARSEQKGPSELSSDRREAIPQVVIQLLEVSRPGSTERYKQSSAHPPKSPYTDNSSLGFRYN
jgi:hypothetical protein